VKNTLLNILLLLVFSGCSDSTSNRKIESFEDHVKIANAINANDLSVAKQWIASGGNPSAHAGDGITPMHMASSMHCVQILELFLDHNGDPNVADKAMNTPLHYAAENLRANSADDEKMQTLKLLIKFGAKPNAVNADGVTPEQLAINKNNDKISADYLRSVAEQRDPGNGSGGRLRPDNGTSSSQGNPSP
jgi:ankyrin repeat protein